MADHMYKLSEIPKKERLSHFWEYYKVPAIITVVVAIIVISMIKLIFFSTKPDNSVLLASSNVIPVEAELALEEELYGVAVDYNEDGKTSIDFSPNIVDDSNEIDIQHYAVANQKLVATLATDAYTIQIVDETMYNFLKEEHLIGTYAEFEGYNTGMPANEDVKIPLKDLDVFKKSASFLPYEYYITIRDRFSSHIEGDKKKTQNYNNHIDLVAKIAGFEKK